MAKKSDGKVKVPVVVDKKKKAEVKTAEDLVDMTRMAYSNFRSSWFEFAKSITEVHDSEAWNKLGHTTFKEYCLVEFSDMSYSTIVKFVSVMHSHLGILLGSKVEKDPDAPLPAWETCYQVKIAETKLPEEEMPKLYRDVLDCNLSLNKVMKKIEDIKVKRDLIRVKADSISDEDAFKTIDVDVVDEDEVEVEDEVVSDEIDEIELQAKVLIGIAKNLRKGVESLSGQVEEGTELTVKLAEDLYEKLIPVLNMYVDKMEALTSEEEV
jgi:hypothetical protein